MEPNEIKELKERYMTLQKSLKPKAKIPLRGRLNEFLGLEDHVEMYLTKEGTVIVSRGSELPGTDAAGYVDGVIEGMKGLEPEEAEAMFALLKRQIALYKIPQTQ